MREWTGSQDCSDIGKAASFPVPNFTVMLVVHEESDCYVILLSSLCNPITFVN